MYITDSLLYAVISYTTSSLRHIIHTSTRMLVLIFFLYFIHGNFKRKIKTFLGIEHNSITRTTTCNDWTFQIKILKKVKKHAKKMLTGPTSREDFDGLGYEYEPNILEVF